MYTIIEIANYFAAKYKKLYKKEIDEDKLYALLYFSQREAVLNNKKEVFTGNLSSTATGFTHPVIHKIFPYFSSSTKEVKDKETLDILNKIFEVYNTKDTAAIIQTLKGESSWIASRKGVSNGGVGKEITPDDIKHDAEKIKERKKYLHKLGL